MFNFFNQSKNEIDAKYLGYFCKELCSQELSKIAQTGHTVDHLSISHSIVLLYSTFNKVVRLEP